MPGTAAALCIQRQGAIPSMPTREEVEKEGKAEKAPQDERETFPSSGTSNRSMSFDPPKQTFW